MTRFSFGSQSGALVAAFFVAPLGSAVWGAGASRIFSPNDLLGPTAFAGLFYIVSLPVGIALGLPSLYLLARLKLLAGWSVLFTALSAGVIISQLLHVSLLLYAPVGLAWATIFYPIWLCGPEPTNAAALRLMRKTRGIVEPVEKSRD